MSYPEGSHCSCKRAQVSESCGEVVLVSLFDSLVSSRRGFDDLGLGVAMHLDLNTDKLARRVVKCAWPDEASFDNKFLSENDTVLEIRAAVPKARWVVTTGVA